MALNKVRSKKLGKRKKPIIIAVIILALLAIVVLSGMFLYKTYAGKKVSTYSVSDLSVGDWQDSSIISGMIINNAVQEVILSEDKSVGKVYVKDGEAVKKGDKLFKYDMTLNELELESSKLNRQSLQLKIQTLKSQIANPRKYLMEEYTSDGGVFAPSANQNDKEEGASNQINIKNIDEKNQSEEEGESSDSSDDDSADRTDQTDGAEDFYPQEDIEEEPVIVITQEEINEYVAQKRSDLREAELEISKTDLEISRQEKALKTKTVKSKIDGIVELGEESADIYMTIRGGKGLYVQGTLNEYLLREVKVGDVLQGEDYYTGETFEAEIQTISEYPVQNGDSMQYDYGENVSYYSFTALISEDLQASPGDDVALTLESEVSEDSIFLEKAFVINENGNSYAYIKGVKGRLQKKRLEIGKTVEGTIIEIKSGITINDRTAFPYGKDIKEGAKTADADIDTLYQ